MKSVVRNAAAAIAVAAGAISLGAISFAGAASAAPVHFRQGGADHAVFVQTDNPAGNQIIAYQRAADGTLNQENVYNTGGLGGILNGSAADHLASQGSLTYDQKNGLLIAVNAGSNTVSVFSVNGDQLKLLQVISSGGVFPVSVAVHGNLVDVLNAEGGGSVQSYVALSDRLFALPGSNRNLGLTIPTDTTQFTHTPGQVAFSPDGSQLIVTTKDNTNAIDVFRVGFLGYLSSTPMVNVETGALPFGVTFDGAGHLVVADTGTNSLATYRLSPDGTVTLIDSVPSTQAATCWVAPAAGYLYTSNAGSGTTSDYQENGAGQLTLLGQTATDPGTVDASASAGGHFLYVQTGGKGIVDEFQVEANGSLTELGSVTVPNAAGGEGIVAF